MHKLLHTEVVVLQRQRGVTSFTHDGRHCDLPDSEVTVLLLVLLFLLDVQCCFSAGRWNQLVPGRDASKCITPVIGRHWSAAKFVSRIQFYAFEKVVATAYRNYGGKTGRKGKTKTVLTINLLVPFKLSKNSFRAVLSFSLASLLDFFPLPFFPFLPLPFFWELSFSCVSSFTSSSFLCSFFFPPCIFFVSSTEESSLQLNRGKLL